MIEWGVVTGCVAAGLIIVFLPLLARAFTGDVAVQHQLQHVLWAVALMQPLAAIVFVLDGILIGAGDSRYLALAMVAASLAFVPAAILVLATHAGLLALWGALYVFVLARFVGMYIRFRRDDWLVTGAVRGAGEAV